MEVKVILRAALAQYGQNQKSSFQLTIPERSCVLDVMRIVGLPENELYLTVVNHQLVSPTDKLLEGDLIEFVPPIAGGRGDSAELKIVNPKF